MADSSVGLFDKIKLLLWLNSLGKQVSNGGLKMSAFLAKFDGIKSVAGLLMVVAYYALPQFHIQVPDVVLKIGTGLASVGLAHKLEKGTGLLTTGIDYSQKALDVLKSVIAAMSAKEEPKA